MSSALFSGIGWDAAMGIRLYEKLRTDLKSAMLNKSQPVKNTIRQIMAEFPKLTVPLTLESGKKSSRPKQPAEITDDDIINIIQGLVKSERTTLELKNQPPSDYLKILETYLPKMAAQSDIEGWIKENVDFGALKNKMQAVGQVMKHFGRSADGRLVKEIVQSWPDG